uniref:Uncharacterized protein n=1 Tax=Anopheles dirus TaxID=7168 RepID=A0A182NFL9_9DIPT
MLDRDPDPYLLTSTGYDYHFTGGAMVASTDNGTMATVFKATGSNLQDVEVLSVGVSDDKMLEVREVQHCPTDVADPILEISLSPRGKIVLVRKRLAILILRKVENSWRTVQQIRSTIAFASVCALEKFFSVDTGILCTTNYRQQLQIWTIGIEEQLRKEDNWSAVRWIDSLSLVACLVRTQIYFYKVKKQAKSNGQRLLYRGGGDFTAWTACCERYCALEVTRPEGLLLVASSHKIIVAQVEEQHDAAATSKQQFTAKVLLVFPHNLKQPPVFISPQRDDAASGVVQHIVLFGSHLPHSYGTVSFTCENASELEPVYSTHHFPYHPPTFYDAYKLARTRGFCLSAYEPLRKRFYACQSGAILLKASSANFHILLQTSGGDLLQQRVSMQFAEKNATNVMDEAMVPETLQRWHETLVKQTGRIAYRATSFKTMRKLRDLFNSPLEANDQLKHLILLPEPPKRIRKRTKPQQTWLLDETATEQKQEQEKDDDSRSMFSSSSDSTAPSSVRRRRKKLNTKAPPPWQQTIEELQQYRDVLAPAMLGVWGIGDAATPDAKASNVDQIPTKLPPLADVHERVDSWVTMNAEDATPAAETKASETFLSPSQEPCFKRKRLEYDEQDFLLPSASQSQSFMASQLSQQPLQTPKSAARPPKRTYTMGF